MKLKIASISFFRKEEEQRQRTNIWNCTIPDNLELGLCVGPINVQTAIFINTAHFLFFFFEARIEWLFSGSKLKLEHC